MTSIFKKHKKEDSVKQRLANLTSILCRIIEKTPLVGISKDKQGGAEEQLAEIFQPNHA